MEIGLIVILDIARAPNLALDSLTSPGEDMLLKGVNGPKYV